MATRRYRPETEEAESKPSFFHPRSRRLHIVLLLTGALFLFSLILENVWITTAYDTGNNELSYHIRRHGRHGGHGGHGGYGGYDGHVGHGGHGGDPGYAGYDGHDDHGYFNVEENYRYSHESMEYISNIRFWLPLIFAIPIGFVIDFWSPVLALQIATPVFILINILIFAFDDYHSWFLVLLVSIICIFPAVLLPAAYRLISKWVPHEEKSTAVSIYTSGYELALVLGYLLFSFPRSIENEWVTICLSTLALVVWVIVWRYLASDDPASCENMDEEEYEYLESFSELEYSEEDEKSRMPIQLVFFSPGFWSLILCSISIMMATTIFQTYTFITIGLMPHHHSGIRALQLIIPLLILLGIRIGWGVFMDNLKAKGLCPTKAVKISQAVSCFGGAVLLLILELHIRGSLWHYVPKEDIYINFILLFLLGACLFISSSGYLTALASIAPSYSGFVASVVFVLQIVGAYLSSSVIIRHNMVDAPREWGITILIVPCALILSGIVFLILGSGKAPKWGVVRQRQPRWEEGEKPMFQPKPRSKFGALV